MAKTADNIVKQIKDHCEISIHSHTPGAVVDTHWHDYFELEIMLEGSYEHICNGKKYISKRGDAWMMSYFDHHSLRALTPTKVINIGFTPNYIPNEISNYIASCNNLLCSFDEDTTEYIYGRCNKFLEEYNNKSAFYRYNCSSMLLEIIISTIRAFDGDNTKDTPCLPGILQAIIPYLYKNFGGDVTLSTVAGNFYVSPGHLGFLFKKTFGTSYNNYVNRIRMKHACDMLISSDMPIREIALKSGYNSQEHFFYTFNKHFGCTPLSYRTSMRKGE